MARYNRHSSFPIIIREKHSCLLYYILNSGRMKLMIASHQIIYIFVCIYVKYLHTYGPFLVINVVEVASSVTAMFLETLAVPVGEP